MVLVHIIGYSCNEMICKQKLQCFDAGGSMFINTYGAYFGITMLCFLPKNNLNNHIKNKSSYNSNIFAMIGTIFLWIFWPSFNSSGASTLFVRQLIIYNTVLSLIGSTVSTFIFSSFYRDKFHMKDILNATLAGGVAIGAGADVILNPAAPLICGFFAGFIATSGYNYLSTYL
jgi:ammonium transporter Rh